MSIFKDIKFFKIYKKILKKNQKYLFDEYNIKIDRAFRMYTVINLPVNEIADYDLNINDIQRIARPYIEEYTKKIRIYLDSIGINELYDFYEFQKIDKYSYLMVIGYNKFKSNNYFNTLKLIYLLLGVIGLITTLVIFL